MKRLRWYDLITHNIYFLGLSIGAAALTPIITPVLVQQYAGGDLKNTMYGLLRACGLAVAVVVQPAAGLLSDRSTARWGRRRPFIAVGALLSALCVLGIGVAGGYWPLFAAMLLLQFASNIAQGALQAVIPDLVPEDQRGRAAAVKAIMELLPVVLVAFTVGHWVAAGQITLAISAVGASYVVTMLIQVAGMRETPLQVKPAGSVREPLLRSLGLLVGLALGALVGAVAGVLVGGLAGLVTIALAGREVAWLVGVGAGGLAAVVTAIVAGVWAAVQIGADARKYPAFTWWVVNRLLYLAAVGSIQGFALYFLQDVMRVPDPAKVTGNLMMVVGICTLVSALPSGYLSDRLGRRGLVALTGVVAAAGTGLILVAGSVPVVLAGGCLIGLATGAFMATNWALGTDLVPAAEAGRFLGVSNLAGAGAGIMGAGIGGPLADYFNRTHPGLGYLVVFGIYGVCFLLSTVSLTQVKLRVPAATATE